MSDHFEVIEEDFRPFIHNVFVDYLSLPDRELKVFLTLKSFAWNKKRDCFPSINSIAQISGKKRRQVSEILALLEKKGLIRIEHNNGEVSIYYIINKYLEPGANSTGCHEPLGATSPPTHAEIRTGTHAEIRTGSNIRETRKENKLKSSCSNAQNFDKFWEAYPKKQGKRDALKAWAKIKESDVDKILVDIGNRLRMDVQWKDKQYIPLPATYLRGERWNDEIVVAQAPTQKVQPKPNEPRSTVPWFNPNDAIVTTQTNRISQGVIADATRDNSGRDHIRRGDLFENKSTSVRESGLASRPQTGSVRSDSPKTIGSYLSPRGKSG